MVNTYIGLIDKAQKLIESLPRQASPNPQKDGTNKIVVLTLCGNKNIWERELDTGNQQ